MKCPNKTILCFAAVLLVVGVMALVLFHQPRYKGHSLSYWAGRYERMSTDSSYYYLFNSRTQLTFPKASPEEVRQQVIRDELQEAIQHIGPDAAPYFLKELEWHSPWWRPWLWRIKARNKNLPFVDAEYYLHQDLAIFGFRILHTNAVYVLPELLNDPRHCHLSPLILPFFGDAAFPAITNALANGDPTVQSNALQNLYAFRKLHGNEIMPFLLKLAGSSDPGVRGGALAFFCSYDISGGVAVPLLIEALSSNDENLRLKSLHALFCYASEATAAVPALEKLKNDPSKAVRNISESAIAAINRARQVKQVK